MKSTTQISHMHVRMHDKNITLYNAKKVAKMSVLIPTNKSYKVKRFGRWRGKVDKGLHI